MDEQYQELKSFKYEVNLLYAESVLKKNGIDFKSEEGTVYKLLVLPADNAKALNLIDQLELDDSDVNTDSDGYIDGYTEWADKQFVTGYFTGGRIPLWMYNKTYAKFYGPFLLVTAALYLILPFSLSEFGSVADINSITDKGSVLMAIAEFLLYVVCGILLTIKGFRKVKKS